MRLEFIASGPALVVEGASRVLVAADLHLGIEADMARHGLHFSSRSKERQQRLLGCIDETDPDLLVLLGDVKHSIPLTTRQEFRERPSVIASFRKKIPLRVLPGNHDPGLERFLEPDELLPIDGALIDGVGYIHGHTYPAPDLAGHLIVAGHHHPLVSLMDEVGCSLRAPAYLFAGLDARCLRLIKTGCVSTERTRVLFMPAFNEYSGYDIRKIADAPFSPLSRCMDRESAEIFLADGTFVGPISAVETNEERHAAG
jgi:metallophosphoesterase superfamily enzyme